MADPGRGVGWEGSRPLTLRVWWLQTSRGIVEADCGPHTQSSGRTESCISHGLPGGAAVGRQWGLSLGVGGPGAVRSEPEAWRSPLSPALSTPCVPVSSSAACDRSKPSCLILLQVARP